MTTVTQRPTDRGGPAPDDTEARQPGTRQPGTPEPRTTEPRTRQPRTRRPSARVLWALAAGFLLAALAVTATLGRAAWQARQADESRSAALAAGRQIAVNFVTMRASSFDADTKRVLDDATGQFRTEYASTLAQLKPVVTANKTVSTVERAEAALVSADDDSARVIVGVVAPTTNASTSTPEKKTYRLRLDLVRVGDAWKVNALDFVS
jgi:Mce-associated membrane protein